MRVSVVGPIHVGLGRVMSSRIGMSARVMKETV